MDSNGHPSRYQQSGTQEQPQGTAVLPMQVEEAARDGDSPSRWVAWQQVIGGFLVIFNAQ